ncbi:hypothetical protein SLS57_008868 [Botryosphaeria dothidea]
MKITILSSTLLATQACVVSATIAKGYKVDNSIQYHIAWIDGDNVCSDYVRIGKTNEGLCDKVFKLRNGYSYVFKGCGTNDFAVYNSNGIFNHYCSYDPKTLGCSANKEWKC